MSIYRNLDYIDGITIINSEGIVLFTIKFDPTINKEIEESIVGKHLFHAFPNINKANSSLFECIEKEEPVERKAQYLKNLYLDDTITDNISFPIRNNGRTIGAIELSKDICIVTNKFKNQGHVEAHNLEDRSFRLHDDRDCTLDNIICANDTMVQLVQFAKKIAHSHTPVFITGEPGTGKALFAQGIHLASPRRDKPFVAQNCSAIPEHLLESVFFGVRTQNNNGMVDNKGLLETCDGGTLFLDDLECLPSFMQAKLLRAIEAGMVRPLGGQEDICFDVRILAASRLEKKELLDQNLIRQDLFYRLSTISLHIPPLRERGEDMMLLTDFFIQKYNKVFQKNIKRVSHMLKNYMLFYAWPGNVIELENFIESGVLCAEDNQTVLDDKKVRINANDNFKNLTSKPLKTLVEDYEQKLIREALSLTRGNVKKAAEYLELPRQTLQQKIAKYSIEATGAKN